MQTMNLDEHRKDANGRAAEWAAARRVLAHAAPPDSVEAQLLRAFAQRHSPKPWYRRWTIDALAPLASIGALGCALVIVASGVHSTGAPDSGRGLVVAAVADDGFLTLAPPDRIAAAVHPQLKRADLSRQMLVQLGIPIAANAPDELIHAELLVAATGEPLAVRLAVN
jgi:hypothetical protein